METFKIGDDLVAGLLDWTEQNVKRIVAEGDEVASLALLVHIEEKVVKLFPLPFSFTNSDQKAKMKRAIEKKAKRSRCDAVVMVTEAHLKEIKIQKGETMADIESKDDFVLPSQDPSSLDVIIVSVLTPFTASTRCWERTEGGLVERIEVRGGLAETNILDTRNIWADNKGRSQ